MNTKSFTEDLWKQSHSNLNLMFWTQEQAEKFGNRLMEQGKVNREEAQQFVQQLWEQSQENQKRFQEIIRKSTQDVFDNWKGTTQSQLDELNRKVDEMMKKMNGEG
ncbi:phasin family protein [Heliorestis convoluta]|uniref:Phasin family protein n=1 Tax=Heliorestis convoluta TaxID=356322 RepID=A0A5Q2N0G5_9FIRM|nr:hypothetical protein [Heliorestis convoluta]QGG46742.1 hypothetical protein FTV88_0563 [Heliorestis convoluta]